MADEGHNVWWVETAHRSRSDRVENIRFDKPLHGISVSLQEAIEQLPVVPRGRLTGGRAASSLLLRCTLQPGGRQVISESLRWRPILTCSPVFWPSCTLTFLSTVHHDSAPCALVQLESARLVLAAMAALQ